MSYTRETFIEPWIEKKDWEKVDFFKVTTPVYVMSQSVLETNAKILGDIQKKSGIRVLMALKSFSMHKVFNIFNKYLYGSEASSVYEARLGKEEFGNEVHTFSPSFTESNIKDYIKYSNHLVFNSFSQWDKFKKIIKKQKKNISCGIRVNLEHSEVDIPIYDPSRVNSHFGVTRENFEGQNLDGIEGLHFHNLCELNADALERSLQVFENKFKEYFPHLKWVNFGGGHHITRADYDRDLFTNLILDFKKKYPHLQVYIEPGEACALNAGVLVAKVIDKISNGIDILVLDVSATTHMPDVLEIPYKPSILSARMDGNGEYKYRLVGPTCLTGDVIGDYTFDNELRIGDHIVFMNMAIYTMVKNNTFNGVPLPDIAILDKKGKIKVVKKFNYKDFKERLS